MKILSAVIASVLLLTGCGSSGSSDSAAKNDPVKAAITTRYGDCLEKLKFTKPYKINVYKSTHKADVSGKPGVIGFKTATANDGKVLLVPLNDGSAQTLETVGC